MSEETKQNNKYSSQKPDRINLSLNKSINKQSSEISSSVIAQYNPVIEPTD